jgi:uncharacterized protein (DUF3084 family)
VNASIDDIKRRILALCPVEQLPVLDFELRMMIATLETNSLTFIHEHWRPIAVDRDQLREQLAAATAKPARDRSPKPPTDENLQSRFDALTQEHSLLKTKHSNLQESHEQLQAEHKKLQQDCDDLLNDKRPGRP